MPAPIFASVPVYVDVPVVSVQTVVAPPIVTCAMPLGILYGRPVDPKLQPVIVDGVTVDFLPLCQTYTYEPFADCGTAYYYYADQTSSTVWSLPNGQSRLIPSLLSAECPPVQTGGSSAVVRDRQPDASIHAGDSLSRLLLDPPHTRACLQS